MRITSVRAVGNIVKQRRQDLGISQAELAQRAHVGRRFIGELEAGKPTVQFGRVLTVLYTLDLPMDIPNWAEQKAAAKKAAEAPEDTFSLDEHLTNYLNLHQN